MKPSAAASRRAVLIDTGPLVAAIDAGDRHHAWAKATLPRLTGKMFTCEAVSAEVMHVLGNAPAAADALQAFLGRMEIVPILRDELDAVFAIVRRYSPRMDLADACMVVLASRHRESIVLTTDTRDFASYRIPFASPEGLFAPG
jgi:predicted nucleic acid-binding protein